MNPKISFRTIKAVASIICGNAAEGLSKPISPYRTSKLLDEFFLEDLALPLPEGITGSRQGWTEAFIKHYNGKNELKKIIESSVRPSDYLNTDFATIEVVNYLNSFFKHDGLVLVSSGKNFTLSTVQGIQLMDSDEKKDILSEEYITELSAKCDLKLSNKDFDGAITNSRTLLEAVLVSLEERLTGKRENYKGDLPKQYKSVSKLLKLDDERTDLDDRFKDVIRGLIMTVNGLAPLRNKMSDGHARERKPAPHHAKVIVNASKTISVFLVESYLFQKEKGDLLDYLGQEGHSE
jgi:hypothetical protein